MEIYRKNAGPQSWGQRFVRACAAETQNGHFTRAILFGNLQEKCRTPIPGSTFCARLRSRNARGHFRRAMLCGSLHEKCRTPIPSTAFCASLRSRNAHGHLTRAIFCCNLQEKMPHTTPPTSIEHRAFDPYRKNPCSVATLFGEKSQKSGISYL